MDTFSMNIPFDNPEAMKLFQEMMNELHEAMNKYIREIAEQYSCSEHCASDIAYLRSRSRWTEELENKLVELDKIAKHPPVLAGWNGEPESEWDKI